MNGGAFDHPKSAAAVAELYSADGTSLNGWVVSVKLDADSAGGQGWYWYAIDSATNAASVVVDGVGVGLCTGCHASGDDYVLTPRF